MVSSALAGDASPITIGVILPLTGPASPVGNEMRRGLELAQDELAAKGGIAGHPVKFAFEDNQARPDLSVIAFNKWDLIDHPQAVLTELREKTERLLPQVRGIQAVPVSAETGRGLDKLMEAVVRTHRVWNSRVSTGKLNRWLETILAHHPPPAVAGRRLKIKYLTQAKTRPPGFVVSCSRPDAVPQSYVRYLTNSLREAFDMPGVPIRMALRTSDNPFAGRAKKRT